MSKYVDAADVVFTRKFVALNTYFRKEYNFE